MIYDRNIEALKKKNANLVQFLQGQDVDNYEVFTSKNGQVNLKVNFPDDKFIIVHDVDDPEKFAFKSIPNTKHKKPMFIVMGIGLGYILFELLRRHPEALCVVIEHDSRIFRRALQCHDFTKLFINEKILFLVSVKPQNLLMPVVEFITKDTHSNYLPTMELVNDESVTRYSKNYYMEVATYIKKAVDCFWGVVIGNSYEDTLLGAQNVFINLRKTDKMFSIEPYRNHFKGFDGIVVSSGPSLNNKLGYLRDIQHHVPIICADSALRVLLENGIKPFGVACLERGVELLEVFKGFEIPKDVVLFMVPQIDPSIIEIYPGSICLLFRGVFPFTILPEIIPMRSVGASCSHMALVMLVWLGCRSVSLVGQDLAYDAKTGKTHFDGIVGYAAEVEAGRDKILVPSNSGGMIESQNFWALFRDIFVQYRQEIPELKLYNVIEVDRGALINGYDRVDPETHFSKLKNDNCAVLPQFDVEFGVHYLRNALKDQGSSIHSVLQEFRDGLQELKPLIKGFDAARSVEDYYWIKSSIQEEVPKKVWQNFHSYFTSVTRRFEALAQSLWTVEEFLKNKTDYTRRACQAIDELLDCLDLYLKNK